MLATKIEGDYYNRLIQSKRELINYYYAMGKPSAVDVLSKEIKHIEKQKLVKG